jgi:hypothetical protein
MKEEIFLVDLLNKAEIQAPGDNYVEIQRMNMNRLTRSALFQHPDSEVIFAGLAIGSRAVLDFETGIAESVWEKFQGTVVFSISAGFGKKREMIFESSLSPFDNHKDRKWHPHSINLDKYAGKTIDLVFTTKALKSTGYAWSAWADPRISHEKPPVVRDIRKDEHHHLIVITADAMSKRFFGCYGADGVKTPNIDQFAKESIIFDEAWSNSTTTPGSYATIWSGLHPLHHHLNSEWGIFPTGVISLPVILNSQGFHTAMFSSEAELSRARFGFSGLFNEVHGAIANPAQDGSITVRQFSRWLDKRPDAPMMCWLQFFDTHPPNQPPAEFSRMYYTKDPEKTISGEEIVRQVYGIETLVELNRSMPWIRKGILPAQPKYRFLETAWAFQGLQPTGPDLYEHLKNLPPELRLGMGDRRFGKWLEGQVISLEEKKWPNPEFIQWLEKIQKELEFIQQGIISWLKNVKDFDYPVSQYKGCMSYFDHLVGQIIKALKDNGIYEQSTIVIVSPHGEILQFDDAVFHHHFPHPNVLSVPMIIKCAENKYQGRVKGVANLADLFPTLLDLMNLQNRAQTDGTSLLEQMKTGDTIPNSYSIAFDLSDILKSVVHPPYFYFRADEDYIITPTKFGKAGEDFLFELTGEERGLGEMKENDAMKAHLRQKLDDFLRH